jgi:tetratricopeptide (TPR) repeat protein
MSAELTRARQQLSQIRGYLRQGKVMPAAQAFQSALVIVLKSPLMRAEREEFERMFADAAHHLNNDAGLRALFPLKIEYLPGSEKELLDIIRELVTAVNNAAVTEAQEQLAALDARKAAGLEQGQAHLDAQEFDAAAAVFRQLSHEFKDDPQLRGEIGERFLKAGRYEEAFDYLAQALDLSPESIHLYNRIGIALRRLGRFETGEKYYLRALQYAGHDPNLLFNLGRLYVDGQRWDKVAKAAAAALRVNPAFDEARKMLEFAERKLQR